ncbi:unnamed protein product [Tilletia controversa]|uniref:Mannose-6-phosphate isomerase n=3 Tax=Tilletia TaxID=13289 RepID=A0A8X7SZ76_9BASI|nr:hypothetical protein CF336_g347 [Tilletia laevis]KAE8203065.1 hypothetical protein CF328_g1853 [Tilletia controversa]KAE8263953.1 hypothetical protein A4X03_0g1300 [Tilletia caries]KAE8207532.1 hypothetical protein CF335_g1070 [Tilletia laevis]KAE8252245.1 hypothetical protein A4X06_0g2327 [Tilletia controversa]
MVFLQPVHSSIQVFDWGKVGASSLAARLYESGGHAAAQGKHELDPDTPYGEFWQGATHIKGPSTIASSTTTTGDDGTSHQKEQLLSDVLRSRKYELLGGRLLRKMPWIDTDTHGGVPILFKILSAGKALPLQAHPDAELAAKLYEAEPGREDSQQVRFDAVHKPEIALALTPFRGFIGFAPPELITQRMELLPELHALFLARNVPVGVSKHLVQDMVDPYHEIVHPHQRAHSPYSWHDKASAAIGRLLGADRLLLGSAIKHVVTRAEKGKGDEHAWPGVEGEQLRSLILELNEQYPGDSGVFAAPVFMNLASLEPGECIYAPADTIHAWLSGDIIEAMPASVNVENAAFGPEPCVATVELFAKMLTYEFKPVSEFKIRAEPLPANKGASIYRIPVEEFDVVKIVLGGKESSHSVRFFTNEKDALGTLDGIAIVGVVRGGGRIRGFEEGAEKDQDKDKEVSYDLREGSVLIVGKGTAIQIEGDELEAYIAVCQPKTP